MTARRTQHSLAPLFAAGLTAATLLAGCGSSTSGGSLSSSAAQRAFAAMLALAHCARAHGLPDFPDPVVGAGGDPSFPNSAPRVPPATQHACQAIAARIPPSYTATQPLSPNELDQLLVLARCIRAHGVPDWPDPNALGQFPIDARLQGRAGQNPGAVKMAVESASRACAHVNPDPTAGLNVVAARG